MNTLGNIVRINNTSGMDQIMDIIMEHYQLGSNEIAKGIEDGNRIYEEKTLGEECIEYIKLIVI